MSDILRVAFLTGRRLFVQSGSNHFRAKEIMMKFKARGLLTVILTTVIVGQALFNQPTGARTIQRSDTERIARLETLLESIRQELKIPAYSAAIVKDQE